MWKRVNYFLIICIGIIIPESKFPRNWHSDILHACLSSICVQSVRAPSDIGDIWFAGGFFPWGGWVYQHILLDGVWWGRLVCLHLPSPDKRAWSSGRLCVLALTGAGSFMKNKLIMHTKLHLQETLRCILQSSQMIRFTFCSQDTCPLLISASWTTSRSARPVFCPPCCTIAGAQAGTPGCQVHCSGQQPEELKA